MANTFAEHIFKRLAQERSAPCASVATKTPQATYASVVLTMAMGIAASDTNAATDGTVASAGNSSSAKLGVSLIIPERIEAHGFGDVKLAERSDLDSEASRLIGQTSGCVLGRGSNGFGISVLPGSPYRLKLVASPEACTLKGDSARQNNGRQNNARLEISEPRSALSAKSASTYGEALTLLITPE